MSRKVYTRVGDAWVRHWDTGHIEVYDEDGRGPLGIVKPIKESLFAAFTADENVLLGHAISREVAVELILLRVDQVAGVLQVLPAS